MYCKIKCNIFFFEELKGSVANPKFACFAIQHEHYKCSVPNNYFFDVNTDKTPNKKWDQGFSFQSLAVRPYSAFCTAVEGCTERGIVVIRTIDGDVTAALGIDRNNSLLPCRTI